MTLSPFLIPFSQKRHTGPVIVPRYTLMYRRGTLSYTNTHSVTHTREDLSPCESKTGMKTLLKFLSEKLESVASFSSFYVKQREIRKRQSGITEWQKLEMKEIAQVQSEKKNPLRLPEFL